MDRRSLFASSRWCRHGLAFAPVGGFLALGGCAPAVLDPAGPIAGQERTILIDSIAIMLIVVVPVIIAAFGFAWRFRAGNSRARYRPDWRYSGQLELLVWSVPALIVMFLGGIAWIGSHDLDPARAPSSSPLNVDVVSLDWKWLFIYPDQGVASVNRLIIPAGRPIRFRLTSATVMNSFFVPRLGSQIYTMAGMTTQLTLTADRPGRYRGLSANYSGKGFPSMAFAVEAVTADQFAGWAANARTHGAILDAPTYLALIRPDENAGTPTYRDVRPKLFETILDDSARPPRRTASDGRSR